MSTENELGKDKSRFWCEVRRLAGQTPGDRQQILDSPADREAARIAFFAMEEALGLE